HSVGGSMVFDNLGSELEQARPPAPITHLLAASPCFISRSSSACRSAFIFSATDLAQSRNTGSSLLTASPTSFENSVLVKHASPEGQETRPGTCFCSVTQEILSMGATSARPDMISSTGA